MGEVAAFAQILNQTGILTAITERVSFARAHTHQLKDLLHHSHELRNELPNQ
jgi:hypothetical protein